MDNNFSESLDKLQNVEEKLRQFLDTFELVFHHDWGMSLGCLQDKNNFYIANNGTFLNPKVDDEDNNWAN